MKLHSSVIERLLYLFETHGGHRNENRLRTALSDIELSEYDRRSGEKILVLTEELEREMSQVAVQQSDIVPRSR